jgi:hypothetical protein
MENSMRIIVLCILAGIFFWAILYKGALTKDYIFVVADGHVYRCNERSGKLTLVTCSSGVVWGNHE